MSNRVINDRELDTRFEDSKYFYDLGIAKGVIGISSFLVAASQPSLSMQFLPAMLSASFVGESIMDYGKYRDELIQERLKSKKPFHLKGLNRVDRLAKDKAYTITKE